MGCNVRFTNLETLHLLFGTLMLAAMFAIAYQWNLIVAVILGAGGLMLHELGHKIAGRMRCIDDVHFTLMPLGLGLGFFTAIFFGQALAAPGGVTVGENASDRDRLIMAIAGPATNLLVFMLGLLLHVWIPTKVAIIGQIQVDIWLAFSFINLYLALFNMIPIYPFDGASVIKHSLPVWGVFTGGCLVIMIVSLPEIQSQLAGVFGGWGGIFGVAQGFISPVFGVMIDSEKIKDGWRMATSETTEVI
jgi:Zn-dependent protease